MKLMTSSLGRLWRWKSLWLVETLLLAIVLASVYGWLALPVARWWHIASHVAVALLVAGLIYLALRLMRRKLAGGTSALKEPAFWLATLLWVLVGLWLPYRLIWWVPALDGFNAQAISAALRFLVAGTLFTGAWMWLAACASRPAGE